MNVLVPTNPADGAFGNKLKSLITCIRSGLPYRVWWLNGFSELLDIPGYADSRGQMIEWRLGCWRLALTHEESINLDQSYRDSYPEFFDCEWSAFNLKFARIRTIDGMYNRIPSYIKFRLCRAVMDIPWNSTMRELFQDIDRQLSGKTLVGVSVRSWKNQFETSDPLAQHRAKSFDLEAYKKVVRKLSQRYEIFMSFDAPELEEEFKDIPNRIFLKDVGFHWKVATPYQKIAAKCYMLSRCKILVGDTRSTYIEAAWLLGCCSADLIDVYGQ